MFQLNLYSVSGQQVTIYVFLFLKIAIILAKSAARCVLHMLALTQILALPRLPCMKREYYKQYDNILLIIFRFAMTVCVIKEIIK